MELNIKLFEIYFPAINIKDDKEDSKSFFIKLRDDFELILTENYLKIKNEINFNKKKIEEIRREESNSNLIHFGKIAERQMLEISLPSLQKELNDIEISNTIFKSRFSEYLGKGVRFPQVILNHLKYILGEEIAIKFIESGILLQDSENISKNHFFNNPSIFKIPRIIEPLLVSGKILNLNFNLFSPINQLNSIEIHSLGKSKFDFNSYNQIKNNTLSKSLFEDVDLNDFSTIIFFDFFLKYKSTPLSYSNKKQLKNIDGLENDLSSLFERVKHDKFNGDLYFIANFYTSKRIIEYFKNIEIKEYNIDSVFTINSVISEELGSSVVEIISIKKRYKRDVFVSLIDNNLDNLSKVIDRYKNRNGLNNFDRNGFNTDLKSYFSFSKLIKIQEYNKLENQNPHFQKHKISDVVTEFKIYDSDKIIFEVKPNSLILIFDYVNHYFNKRILTDKVEDSLVSNNYKFVQVTFDPQTVYNKYLRKYFRKEKTGLLFQNFHLNDPDELLNYDIFIPSLQNQKVIDSKIDLASNFLDQSMNLVESPNKLEEVDRLIAKENSLEDWISICPFPIASILWKYHANSNTADKIKYLEFFFEGLGELLVMLVLSSFSQNEDYFLKHRTKWFTNERFYNWYLTSSFGNWVSIFKDISIFINKELDKGDTLILDLLGNPSVNYLQMIKSSIIKDVLHKTNDLRRDTKGHNYDSDENILKERLKIWEGFLTKILPIVGNGFSNSFIIKPISSSYKNKVHDFKVKYLLGDNIIFKENYIKTSVIMDCDDLYLYHSGQPSPTQIIPFIRYVEVHNAFYFYSKTVGNSYRFVSYHNGEQGEYHDHQLESELLDRFINLLPKAL